MELKWSTKFIASEVLPEGSDTSCKKTGVTKLLLKGVLIDDTENRNQWLIRKENFEFLAKDFIGKQVRLDHQEKTSGVVGKILSTEIDQPHPTEDKAPWDRKTDRPHIHFAAEIMLSDMNIIIPIKNGYVDSVSPAVDSRRILCSECGADMQAVSNTFIKTCGCENGIKQLEEITSRELSIVASPAYDRTLMQPFGFAASLNRELLSDNDVLSIVENELSKRITIHTS